LIPFVIKGISYKVLTLNNDSLSIIKISDIEIKIINAKRIIFI